MRLFLDTNVTLDVLARREPWLHDSATVLSLLESDEFDGIVATHSITTLQYLCVKELGRSQATVALIDLLRLVSVAPLDQETILKAIALDWRDFEDAIQMLSATDANADFLVTRNASDFKASPIPVVTPSELLAILRP
ncbi:MAG: PIN domain-containing protein [Gemmatimonadota bacterium]